MTEKDIEDLIMGALKDECGRAEMKKRGFPVFQKGHTKFYRQVRISGHGVADIVALGFSEDKEGKVKPCITVYELKRDSVGSSDIEQVTRYTSGIVSGLGIAFMDYYSELSGGWIKGAEPEDFDVNMVLIGSSCDFPVNGVLTSNSALHFYTYHMDAINGITFSEENAWYYDFETQDPLKWVSYDFAQGLRKIAMALAWGESWVAHPAENEKD